MCTKVASCLFFPTRDTSKFISHNKTACSKRKDKGHKTNCESQSDHGHCPKKVAKGYPKLAIWSQEYRVVYRCYLDLCDIICALIDELVK